MKGNQKSRAYWLWMWGVLAVMVVSGCVDFLEGNWRAAFWAMLASAWMAMTLWVQSGLDQANQLAGEAVKAYGDLVDRINKGRAKLEREGGSDEK